MPLAPVEGPATLKARASIACLGRLQSATLLIETVWLPDVAPAL